MKPGISIRKSLSFEPPPPPPPPAPPPPAPPPPRRRADSNLSISQIWSQTLAAEGGGWLAPVNSSCVAVLELRARWRTTLNGLRVVRIAPRAGAVAGSSVARKRSVFGKAKPSPLG